MRLFWLDIETTGLDPTNDAILELAIVEADFANPFELVKPVFDAPLQWRGDREKLHPRVQEMHTKNGLFARCAESPVTLSDAEEMLLEELGPVAADRDERPVLAGSSIHFDLSFLRRWMPRFADRLSHRLYDVSAVKLFCQSLGMPKFPKAEAHTALADLRESADHARRCVEWLRSFHRKKICTAVSVTGERCELDVDSSGVHADNHRAGNCEWLNDGGGAKKVVPASAIEAIAAATHCGFCEDDKRCDGVAAEAVSTLIAQALVQDSQQELREVCREYLLGTADAARFGVSDGAIDELMKGLVAPIIERLILRT